MGARAKFIADALRAAPNECVVWPFAVRQSSGYGAFNVKAGGQVWNFDAHRYVCMLAWGMPPAEHAVALHSCDNPLCINPHHLRWGTHEENMADAAARNRVPGGGRYSPVITPERRARVVGGHESFIALAKEFGTCPSHVAKVRRAG